MFQDWQNRGSFHRRGAAGSVVVVTTPPRQQREEEGGLARFLTGKDKKKLEKHPEIYNSIASDFGLRVKDQMNETAVAGLVDKLDREVDLMMVVEHINESLVLLKRRACLRTKDIVYVRLNSARHYRLRQLSRADEKVLRAWQMADHTLYDHFYRKFVTEVKKEGKAFWQELRHFKQILLKTRNFCESLSPDVTDVLRVKASLWSEEFTLNAEDCHLMNLKETDFQRRLVNRALKRRLEHS